MAAGIPIRGPGDAPVIGIAGWKSSGKTTLVEGLTRELTQRGWRIATVKHAHHAPQLDDGDTDSARHRRAGAQQVAIVSPDRWAMIRELRGTSEPTLADILARFDPCDLVLVEGYKSAPIPKIEARRLAGAPGDPLAANDANVIAIAADHPITDAAVPVFQLDDVARIADFIVRTVGARQS